MTHGDVVRIGPPLVKTAPRQVAATDADLREFRANMTIVRRFNRGPVAEALAQVLAGPLSLRHALRGVRRYGRAVRDAYGVSVTRQFLLLAYDYFCRIRPHDFYLFRLYLPQNRRIRTRSFSFAEVLPMQQYLIDRSNCPDYPLLRSKSKFAETCLAHGLPTVPLIAEFSAGQSEPARPALPDTDLFSKASDMMLGMGAALWRRVSPGLYVNAIDGTALDAADLCDRLRAESARGAAYGGSGALVLQRRVVNHPAMRGAITTGALASIRVVTCRTPDGGIDLLPPAIRMPVGDAIVDNAAQGAVASPIDPETGRICGPGVRKDERLGISIHHRHPTTGTALVGFQIPYFPEVLALARRAHEVFSTIHFVGWDIAVLPDGPVLMEGNAWWDVEYLSVFGDVPQPVTLADTPFVAYCNHHFRALRAGSGRA